MKKILTVIIIFFTLLNQSGQTANVTLAWDPSPCSDIVGYNVYYGFIIPPLKTNILGGYTNCGVVFPKFTNVYYGTYTKKVSVKNVTIATVSNLVVGATYCFAATAMDTEGNESEFSNEVQYTVPEPLPNTPTNLPTAVLDFRLFNVKSNIYK